MTGPRSPLFTSVRQARRRRGVPVLRIVLVVVVIVLVAALGTTLALWQYAGARLERTDIPALAAGSADTDAAAAPDEGRDGSEVGVGDSLNVLVVGTDSREGLTEADLQELGTEDVGTRLTDTLMLVQVSPAREQAAILSFPRDLVVAPPGEGRMKVNAVHARGGPDLLVRTIQDYTGIPIDHYVEVDLAGFIQLTDAIGGVELCLDAPKVDVDAGVDLPAGCQVLDGKAAAGFVRSRKDADQFGGADDFGRIARQQAFLKQAMREVTSAGTLLNPLKLKRLIDAVADNVITDRDLGPRDMLRLASSLEGLTADDLQTRVVPGYWDPEDGYTHPYPERAEALFQAFREHEPLPDVGLTDPHENELTADQVEVSVLNGIGRGGLAGEVAGYLEARGFAVVATGNVDPFDPAMAVTTVTHGPDGRSRAKLVAQYLPGAELVELPAAPTGADVVVTVANDWLDR